MRIRPFIALGISLFLLAGCVNDPMKPPRPFGRRVPVNTTPPPAAFPVMPVELPEVGELSGESNNG